MKKLMTVIAVLAAATLGAKASVLFDGATDAVYKATGDSVNVTLSEPTAGNWVLSGSVADDTRSYIFGNLNSATTLATGETLKLAFRINNLPNASNQPLSMVLTGSRGIALTTTDVAALDSFAGSYAGLKTSQYMNTAVNAVRFADASARPAGNTTVDNNLLFLGKVNTSMGQFNTLTGNDRFDSGRTADLAMTVSHDGTAWTIGYTLSMVGGTGPQSFTSTASTPSSNDFMLTDAFTTFAIGFEGGLDNGSAMAVSDVSITYIPEPGTLSMLLGAGGLMALRRRRRA